MRPREGRVKRMKLTISKTIKLPIPGINYSNQVVSVTEEHEVEKPPDKKQMETLWGKLNERLELGLDKDLGDNPDNTSWLREGRKK